MHYILDIEFPPEKMVNLGLLFRGLARKNPHLPIRVLPMTPQILLDIFHFYQAIRCHYLVCLFICLFSYGKEIKFDANFIC